MFHNTAQHDWQLNEKIEHWQLENGNAKLMRRQAAAHNQAQNQRHPAAHPALRQQAKSD